MADERRRSRRTLWIVLAVCAAPLVASYTAYYLLPARQAINYGELLPTQIAPPLAGRLADGAAWTLGDEKGHWTIVVAADAACDEGCAERLYATRQARTMQGREQERVARVWLVTGDGAPRADAVREHPDLAVVRADAGSAARLPRGEGAIYLVDPLGNQVLAWPARPDVRGVARDLTRLHKTSRIG